MITTDGKIIDSLLNEAEKAKRKGHVHLARILTDASDFIGLQRYALGRVVPPFLSPKGVQFYARDSDGQWFYVNHADSWCTCPPPADPAPSPSADCRAGILDLAGRVQALIDRMNEAEAETENRLGPDYPGMDPFDEGYVVALERVVKIAGEMGGEGEPASAPGGARQS